MVAVVVEVVAVVMAVVMVQNHRAGDAEGAGEIKEVAEKKQKTEKGRSHANSCV